MGRINNRFHSYLPSSFYFTADMKDKNRQALIAADWWNIRAILQAIVGGKFDEGNMLW
jgi:hypothetical protein